MEFTSGSCSIEDSLQEPLDLSKYLKNWLEIYQEQDWDAASLLRDQLVKPKIQLARKLGVLNFLDELAVDEFIYLEDQIYHLENLWVLGRIGLTVRVCENVGG